MEDLIPIRFKIADREVKLQSQPEEEEYVRRAAGLIQERLEMYRKAGHRDTQDILTMIALDCLVTRIKGDEQLERMKKMVFDKITQLDQAVTQTVSS